MTKNDISAEQIIWYLKEYYKLFKKAPVSTDLTWFPFNRKYVLKYFISWNVALQIANIPLNRNKPKELICKKCNNVFLRQIKEIKKSNNQFCSQSCSASFYTLGRKHTNETKRKISESLKAHKIFIDKSKNKKQKIIKEYYV